MSTKKSQDEKMQEIKDKICKMDGAVCNLLITCNQIIKMLQDSTAEIKSANIDQQDIWLDDKCN